MKLLTSQSRVFAIGLGTWVELQTCSKPPRARISTIEKPYKRKVLDYKDREFYWLHGYWRGKMVAKVFKMTSTVYMGGRVLATVKARRFSDLTKIGVKKGGMFELSPELINLLAKKGILNVKGISTVIPAATQPPVDPTSASGETQTDSGTAQEETGGGA